MVPSGSVVGVSLPHVGSPYSRGTRARRATLVAFLNYVVVWETVHWYLPLVSVVASSAFGITTLREVRLVRRP